MKPAAFHYHVPATVAEAVALLGELGEDAKVLAGGQSLTPMLAMRLAVFGHLVDVARIPELQGLEPAGPGLTVGAMVRDVRMERDPAVAAAVPLLAKATPWIGHFQIRNRGTVGGSLAHADPAAEYPAVALALDATFELVSAARGTRTVGAVDFFDGVWSTALEADELLTAVHFPAWDGRCGFAVAEFARRHGDFALAGATTAVRIGDDGRIQRAAIAMFGMGSTPLRARTAESALTGTRPRELPGEGIGRLALADVHEPPDDVHAPSAYRLRIGAGMVSRAWSLALEDAGA